MKPTAVIQVDGILRKPGYGHVLDTGRRLYHGLAATYNVVLVSHESDKAHLKEWLAVEGFDKHAHIEWLPSEGVTPNYWHETVNRLKARYGYPVEYAVITDPRVAARLLGYGYNVLLVANAAYAVPEWHPDTKPGVRAWQELTQEIDRQRQLRAADKRMEDHE